MKPVVDQLAEKWVEPETAVCMVTLMRPLLAAKRDSSALLLIPTGVNVDHKMVHSHLRQFNKPFTSLLQQVHV